MRQQHDPHTLQSAPYCSAQHMDKLLGGSARELLSAAVAAIAARQLPHAWRLQLGEARLARLQDAVRDPARPPHTF